MRRNLPGKTDLIVLASMAGVAACVFAALPTKDSALFFLSFPLFGVSAMLGLKRSGRLGESDE